MAGGYKGLQRGIHPEERIAFTLSSTLLSPPTKSIVCTHTTLRWDRPVVVTHIAERFSTAFINCDNIHYSK